MERKLLNALSMSMLQTNLGLLWKIQRAESGEANLLICTGKGADKGGPLLGGQNQKEKRDEMNYENVNSSERFRAVEAKEEEDFTDCGREREIQRFRDADSKLLFPSVSGEEIRA